MKKVLLFAFVLIFLSSLQAQQEARVNASEMVSNKLFAGLGGAYTTAAITQQNAYGEAELEYDLKSGHEFSFHLGYLFDEHIGFETGLSIFKTGVAYKDVKQTGKVFLSPNEADSARVQFMDVSRDITLNYLSVPVLFRFSMGAPENRSKFRVLIGPQFAFLRNATQVYNRIEKETGEPLDTYRKDLNGKWFKVNDEDITSRYSKNDIMVTFDIGGDFLIGNHFLLSTGIRGNYGFHDVNAEPYRLKSNRDNLYMPSHNLFGGIYLSLNYLIAL